VPTVRRQLDGYGITKTLGADTCYETPREALDAFHAARGHSASGLRDSRYGDLSLHLSEFIFTVAIWLYAVAFQRVMA